MRIQYSPPLSVSGEGLFVYQATGRGIVFVQSLGAIIQRQLAPGEQWIGMSSRVLTCSVNSRVCVVQSVDNGHLVAWTAKYSVERIGAGGFMSSAHTDEGLVCRCVSEIGQINGYKLIIYFQIYWPRCCLFADAQPRNLG